MNISKFDKAAAHPAHGGTILAAPFVPEGMNPPFSHAWGYIEGHKALEPHSHAADEIYFIFKGTGVMTIDGEDAAVGVGDVIAIPGGATHSIRSTAEELLYTAVWWTK